MKRTMVLVTAIAMLLAACGGDDSDVEAEDPVSVADAVGDEGKILVSGYLFELADGTVVLAELIAESSPPQPAGATIVVEGLQLDGLDLEQAPDGSEIPTAQWSSEPITLTGSIMSGVLDGAELG